MLLAVAVLLLQPLAIPQNAIPQQLIAPVTTLATSAGSDSRSGNAAPAAKPTPVAPEELLLPEFDTSSATFEPGRTAPEPVPPTTLVTVIVVPVPPDSPDIPDTPDVPDALDSSTLAGAADFAQPAALREIAAVQPGVATEGRLAQQRRIWLGLSMAQHGAAAFDAWSTRRAITSGAGRELNPMLRPFAGNASLYAAIQVGPLVLDYVSRRMMTSRHGWERRTWWLPQTVGMAMSIASGAHNLGLRAGN
jgi:hypothetical protein